MAATSTTVRQSVCDRLNALSKSFPATDEQVHSFMVFIGKTDVCWLNLRIKIADHCLLTGLTESIPPKWHSARISRSYSILMDRCEESTTTLANIIATNELNLTETQMFDVFSLLLEKGVDVAGLDKTCYYSEDLTTNASHNNPLKSLIVAAKGAPKIVTLIQLLITSLKSLPGKKRASIINNVDHYVFGSMTPAAFLLRLGFEHLALQLYRYNARPDATELVLACASFGTTSYTKEAGECIEYIIKNLRTVSKEIFEDAYKNLAYCSQGYLIDKLNRLKNVLRGAVLFAEYSPGEVYLQAKNISSSQLNGSFDDWCKELPQEPYDCFHSAPDLLQLFVIEIGFDSEYLARGLFSAYYREDVNHLKRRYEQLVAEPELAARHEALCSMLRQCFAEKQHYNPGFFDSSSEENPSDEAGVRYFL